MRNNHLCRWFMVLFIISFLFLSSIDGKGFGGRGGGGAKGGSRGGGSWGGSKSSGTFGGASGYRYTGGGSGYNYMNKPRSGSSFRSNAMSFGAGALGAMTAYSLMRSMSGHYHPGSYGPGYGVGETCINNEDLNGTKFGTFRCPLNGFPYEARSCCGEYGKQYCCIRETNSRILRSPSNLGWIFLLVIIVLIVVFIFAKNRRQKDVIMVPLEPPANEQQGQPFYQPPPPPMGYPPPPSGNPYAVPPQNYDGNYNPYVQQQQQQMPYPQQPTMPYPTQQQSYNPYAVKESNPPAYDDAVRNNQGIPTTRPT